MNSPAANPVIHLELHTGDLQGAVSFYAQLFGWQPERIRAGAGSYMALEMGDRVGGGVVECAESCMNFAFDGTPALSRRKSM